MCRGHDQPRRLAVESFLDVALVGCMVLTDALLLHAEIHLVFDGCVDCLPETGVEILHSLLKVLEQAVVLKLYLVIDGSLLVMVATVQSLQLVLLLLPDGM